MGWDKCINLAQIFGMEFAYYTRFVNFRYWMPLTHTTKALLEVMLIKMPPLCEFMILGYLTPRGSDVGEM